MRRSTRLFVRSFKHDPDAEAAAAATLVNDIEDAATPPTPTKKRERNDDDATPKKKRTRTATPTPKKFRAFKEPSNWREVYHLIKEYRAVNKAPVDDMGCGILASRDLSPEIYRYQTLCALQLSSQTKDPITAAAIDRLKTNLPDGLTPQSILKTDLNTLRELIKPVGFYNNKATYMQKTARILMDEHGGDIPSDAEGLLGLPGVGPKMAYLAMQCAWGVNQGIGVDTHVHRISGRLGWCDETTDPEKARLQLESWLPKDLWADFNPLLVGLGQTVCSAVQPSCQTCPAANLCPKIGVPKRKTNQA